MDTIKENYRLALHYIGEKDYLRAKKLLEDIAIHYPNSQVMWALALVEAMTGNPFQAKRLLRSVSPEVIPQAKNLQEKIEHQIPEYKLLFSSYNDGIEKVKKGQYLEALQDFSDAFDKGKDLPLPVAIYKGYLLSLMHSGDQKKAFDLYRIAPLYIQQSIDLSRYRSAEKPKKSSRRWIMVAAFVTVLMIGLFVGSKAFPDTKEIPVVAEDNETAQEEEEFLSEQSDTIATLESKLDEQMATYEMLEEEYNEMEERIGFVADAEDINAIASNEAYQQGLQAYQQGDYQNAAILLEKSYRYDDQQYFSDDARYYQIQAFQRAGQSIEEEIFAFITSTNSHFQTSPYRDDLMLQLAELSIDKGKVEQATELLREIVDTFPQQWTAISAQTHLNKLLEEE
ncbi:tetratricopeptide repeat protein [Gracilibacillus massiliensis]|uniref:tetratricopeptide repeat protein n=1 Tax=Gracilibacillus massiliensis TaxID=1564956 RepID=UPI00071C7620|nr:tetratricopeptide repeat protein [Gracilibacillus massiliensis]